ATLERARTAVRDSKRNGVPAGGLTVTLRGGVYERSSPFVLDESDSGESNNVVTYRSQPGEVARVVGARALRPEWFTPVTSTSPVWARVDPEARGHVLEVSLPAHGISDYGRLQVRGFAVPQRNAALE